MFMDATGHMACSLVKSDKHEHTVLSSQVTVTYTDQDGQERVVRGGSEETKDIIPGRSTEISITVLTSERRRGPQSWSKRSVRAADINREIKRSAVANGFPPQHFSTRSYRLQLAKNNQLAGVPVAETCWLGAG